MKSIFDVLKNGTGKERLAVVADITSILGVSLATTIGGALALKANFDVENVAGVLIAGLLWLAGTCVVIALFLAASWWLRLKFQANSLIRRLIYISLWLVFTALFLYSIFWVYFVLTSVHFIKS